MTEPDRFADIISLLETRDDDLPTPLTRPYAAAGFVNTARPRSCPDCLANGRTMFGCETCNGTGIVQPAQLDRIATVDENADDTATKDPYARNDVLPIGFDVAKHDAATERDHQIHTLEQQTRPPRSEAELLAEANQRGYAWEERRQAMYRNYDYQHLDRALDDLRATDEAAYHALHSVYVYRYVEPSATLEASCFRGITFLDARLPNPLRAPVKHPALVRIERTQQKRNAA
jgi:hypothetical protein